VRVGLFTRRKLPAGRRPALGAEERVVAWAGATGDDVVVLTNLGLWLPGAAGRLGWHEIHKATWSGRQLSIVAARPVAEAEGYTVMADLPALTLTLLDPDKVPDQLRARVDKSVAYSSHHELPGGGGVRVVARRVPGADGLNWTVRYDEGTDGDAPEVVSATAELVADARAGAEVS
jgi:hypothetical protein